MTAFENATYNASSLLHDYTRELARLNERWPDIEAWYDEFYKRNNEMEEKRSDAYLDYRDKRREWLTARAGRLGVEMSNASKSWWQTQEPLPVVPPEPEMPDIPNGYFGFIKPVETILRDQFNVLRAQLQAGVQAAALGSTLTASPQQMTEIYNIVNGTLLDNLFKSLEQLTPPQQESDKEQK